MRIPNYIAAENEDNLKVCKPGQSVYTVRPRWKYNNGRRENELRDSIAVAYPFENGTIASCRMSLGNQHRARQGAALKSKEYYWFEIVHFHMIGGEKA